MRIITRLRAISSITLAALGVLGIVLLWAVSQFDAAKQNFHIADEIRVNLLERIALRDQYFLYHEERQKQQWDNRLALGVQLIVQASQQTHGKDFDEILGRIQRETEESSAIYRRITANVAAMRDAPHGDAVVYDELDKRLSSQLLLKHVQIRNEIAKLQEISQSQSERAYRNLILAVIMFALGVASLVLAVSWQLGHLLHKRLYALHAGAASITGGNLAARVVIDGHDEFSDLGHAFNTMTDKLESFTKQLEQKIAEQRLTEIQLQNTLEKQQAILNRSEVAISWASKEGRIEYVNPKFEALFGYRLEEIPTVAAWMEKAYPDASYRRKVVNEWEAKLAATRATKAPLDPMEIEITAKDGSRHQVLLMASWAGDQLLAMFSDMTFRHQAERDLRIAAVTFDSQQGILVTNPDGVILRVNAAFTQITGFSPEEATGQTPRLLRSGYHPPDFYRDMWLAVKHTGTWAGEIWNRRKNGEIFPEWLTVTAVVNADGETTHYVGMFSDMTARKAAEDEIRNLAFYDPLTHLPNRRLLLDRLKQALASGSRDRRYGALLFIDLDNFKALNDTRGHDVGDILLQQVAQRLVTCVREGDTVARLGGDEFVVMLEELSTDINESAGLTKVVGEKILAILNAPYPLLGQDFHNSASIGATLFIDHQEHFEDLLRRADLAMYRAKSEGRNTLRFFDPEMQELVTRRAALEADLRRALELQQFVLYYQAQVNLEGQLIGAEALIRWQHPERGMVSPFEFIPIAEDTKLIIPIGNWVLDTACRQLADWARCPGLQTLSIAVNVSATQFHQDDFVDQVLAVVARTGAPPERLKIELTESLLVQNVDSVIRKMAALKDVGISFSLDDFGTGYSSLAYLKQLPLDQLKIDQGFVRDILVDPNDAAIARMVVSLAESMGLAVIAEGVETVDQMDYLKQLRCHAFQGYLFSRPVPVADFEALLASTPVA